MKIPLSLDIALKFSRGQRRGGIMSLISFMSTLGIALGIAVLIIGLSAMNGFERELENRILSTIPHGEIIPIDRFFTNWRNILKRIESVPGILIATPYLNFTGFIEHNDKWKVIQIKGIDPLLSKLPYNVQNNSWVNFKANQQQIIVGKDVADTLEVQSGDWLSLIIPNHNTRMTMLQSKRIRLQVSDILVLNNQLDYNVAIVPLADAQRYLQVGEGINGISIKVRDIFNAHQIVRNASVATNFYVKFRSWISTYGYMYHDIQMIRAMLYLALILVIGVSCFNIISLLLIALKDKSMDIAILLTLGAEVKLTCLIFIWYGLLSGLTGSTLGVIIGIFIALNLTTLIKWLENFFGQQLLSNNVYFIDFIPSEVHLLDLIIVLMITFLLILIASWYPAKRVSHIDPIKFLSTK